MSNPSFGEWYIDDDPADVGQPKHYVYTYDYDEGKWCPHCLKNGVYSWMSAVTDLDTKKIIYRCVVHS